MNSSWSIDGFGRFSEQVSVVGAWLSPVQVDIEHAETGCDITTTVIDLETGQKVRLTDLQMNFIVERYFEPPIKNYDKRFELLKHLKKLVYDNNNFFPERRRRA